MSTCHFITLNARGLRNKEKRHQLFRWFKYQKTDVIFIQETYWSKDIENVVRSEWRGQCFFCHGSNHASGVAILFDQKLAIDVIEVKGSNDGRILLLKVNVDNVPFTFANIYVPTKKKYKENFFKTLQVHLLKNYINAPDSHLILGGDWNCVMNIHTDVKGTGSSFYKKPRNFVKMIKQYSLCDIWRRANPLVKQFTWRNVSLHIASRLDYWLINKNVQDRTIHSDIRPAIRADHNAVSLKIRLKDAKPGPGYWKMNTRFLKDENYQKNIRDIIKEFQLMDNLDDSDKWEMLKIKIKEFTQKFCNRVRIREKEQKQLLQENLEFLDKQIDNGNKDIDTENRHASVKKDLENIYKIESKGAGIRARVKWMEEGERSTKYFLSLEKRNGAKKRITQIESICGKKVLKKENDILKETVKFYKTLYTNENINENLRKDYVQSQNLPILSSENNKTCEGLLTIAECKKVLLAMQKNKAPGSDGIPIEFYQTFWSDIDHIVVNALNACYDKEIMSNTQRKGLITLLFKKGNRLDLKNWRPITLLNCDYKILAAVLSKRLQKVLKQIIDPNQTGYMKGRLAAHNVRLTKDIIEYMLKSKENGAIMMVDFTKAFDVIDMSFVNECLDKLNFGISFKKWVKILYTNINSSVIVNGWISEVFFSQKRNKARLPPLSIVVYFVS